MAKKNKDKDGISDLGLGEEKKENKLLSIAIIIVIVLIWLAIIAILIKIDVGGFGSKIKPVLKNVPLINKILPDDPAGQNNESEDYPYKSLADAITYIKELEVQLGDVTEKSEKLSNENEELQKEVDRLKVFENNQKEFETLKSKFYDEVVFSDAAIDYENYITYYQSINPEKAEELYQEAVEKYAYQEVFMEQAESYAKMEPSAAAAIFIEMSGDMDMVVDILRSMKTANRASIIEEVSKKDANYAAKLTKLLIPKE